MEEKHFIFVYDQMLIEEIYKDFYYDQRVTVTKNLREIKFPLLLLLRKLHLNSKINRIINLPFKSIWSYNLKDVNWRLGVAYYVIFVDNAIFPMDSNYLLKLRKKYNLHYILFFVDDFNSSWGKKAHDYVKCMPFDYIFSFDLLDAEKYNFIYMPIPYSILSTCLNESIQYDLFYIGTVFNDIIRLNTVLNIYELSEHKQVNVRLMLINVDTSLKKYSEKIEYCEPISYASTIEYSKKTNCILEILKETQSGASLRYYEAVCYNKKLLTNNKNVVNLPFYNADYIHVFEKPEDIDWNWVKERIPIDYHYDGRFSPAHLIDKIIELEDTKEE